MQQLTGNESEVWMVVINIKKQYSIWPDESLIPIGWMATGKKGTKEECLNHIASIWPEPTKQTVDVH
ncbi:MbtH family NRPS accessory protein [Xenorhabdus sp. Flor]|uniref:MbtH family NRPS accessory protein n=1 Tax=Xenorhabdus cabanillasii TaxID=351673 RepID=UPI0019C978B5|nr:MbtH family NRPS accessory protein [Xenorhabdus sp. Flor]MBD2813323.1 MbtH family NRPS accessory protein [Xenorhabdus sp. Flor]